MKSWIDWKDLTKVNIDAIPNDLRGTYAIRVKDSEGLASDIIYIGFSGTGKQGLRKRLRDLYGNAGLHSASQKVLNYSDKGLQFSCIPNSNPGGVEKSLLLGFYCSLGKLPCCNDRF